MSKRASEIARPLPGGATTVRLNLSSVASTVGVSAPKRSQAMPGGQPMRFVVPGSIRWLCVSLWLSISTAALAKSQSANARLTPKPNLSKRKLRLPGSDWDTAPPANSGTIWVCVLKFADPTKNPVKRKPPISGLGSPIVCKMLSRRSISFSAGAVTCALIELADAVGGAAAAGATTAGATTAGATTAGGTTDGGAAVTGV